MEIDPYLLSVLFMIVAAIIAYGGRDGGKRKR